MDDLTKTQRCRIDPCPMCENRERQLGAADRLAVAVKRVTGQRRSKRCWSLVASAALLELATALDQYSDLRVIGKVEAMR